MEQRRYGHVREVVPIPDLMELQVKSYRDYLQMDVPAHKRKKQGLEAILQEIFPITSKYSGESVRLEYLHYDLGWPRYTPDECRKLRLTYGMRFRIRVRLVKDEPVEEDIYLGEIPRMIGGGEFIINGAERVIVSQLHRSPGVDFDIEKQTTNSEKVLHKCRIIPERGSWIELNVSKKDVLVVRIDQTGKFPATCLLRAFDEKYSRDVDLIRLFYPTEVVSTKNPGWQEKVKNRVSVFDIKNENNEILLEAGEAFSEALLEQIEGLGLKEMEVITQIDDFLILDTLRLETSKTHKEALIKIYQRLRPGNPAPFDRAKNLFDDKFRDPNKYRLGKVGRFRINRKFGMNVSEAQMTLQPEDFIAAIKYLIGLRNSRGELDDIDHLGNRRVRTIGELAGDEFRKGFLKFKRSVQDKLEGDPETLTPRSIISAKTISSAIDYFFGRGELSQVVDQTNPLSQLTHERRLSALGPGGLNRKRASFEVRDVHISHYGRICPIETPEGTNIGLIASLSIYAKIDGYGFLVAPYRTVKKGVVTDEIRYLRADQEENRVLCPADSPMTKEGEILQDGKAGIICRKNGDFLAMSPKVIELMDVSPKQLVGVSASLIPFLEHDDANRALMGSNMQRQAVPLLLTEPPVVATGMEVSVARNSGMVVISKNEGVVRKVTATEIQVGDEIYRLRKFVGLNERTCLNQTPIVREGDSIKKGDVLADGAATKDGELALGKNVLVAFMPWDGYNFEDAILVSEELVHDDVYTSIHIDEFDTEIRETKLGREEFTRDIPNVSEKILRVLDENGIIRVGTRVSPGGILVGKVAPKSKSELTPEERLLYAIFGQSGKDVKNESLEVPSGVEGIVIDAQKFSRKTMPSEDEKLKIKAECDQIKSTYDKKIDQQLQGLIRSLERLIGGPVKVKKTGAVISDFDVATMDFEELKRVLMVDMLDIPASADEVDIHETIRRFIERIEELTTERDRKIDRLKNGDELQTGVLEMVKVFVATKRTLSVGDKMAGRHGNKGVISKICPKEDMPFLDDGTPVQIVLNPLGVPSRMNVGQILETHLGWAAKALGFQAISPVFDGVPEKEIRGELKRAALPTTGKAVLFDGRTGERFTQQVTVGYLYMLKLHHLVDDKVHARATGPYSLITQQPLGGKARFGGQRFGEMEVWALEAYGAANILQELLTVKSDDVDGRTKIYESMVKGENVLESGTPVSFDVLTNEIRGLAINMELQRKNNPTLN